MAWPFKDGVVKVVVTWGFDGKAAINVHFVLMETPTSPISPVLLTNIANRFRTAIADTWIDRMGLNWQLDDVVAYDWSVEGGAFRPTDGALPIVGVETVDELPAQVALVVSHRTGLSGRSHRGRTYLPGLTEANVDGNTVNAAALTTAALYFTDLRTALALENLDLVVYSLYHDNLPRVDPVATAVIAQVINSRVDTQRRRLPTA